MAQYDFYQDEKCAVWRRTYFSIEAPSWEEALVKASAIIRNEKLSDDDIRIEGSEFFEDTAEALPGKRNPDEPTIKFYAETGAGSRMIADDIHGSVWRTWWGDTDFREMERITGFWQSDFNPEDGYQAFVDACDEWWSGLSEDEKIATWWTHTHE